MDFAHSMRIILTDIATHSTAALRQTILFSRTYNEAVLTAAAAKTKRVQRPFRSSKKAQFFQLNPPTTQMEQKSTPQ
ncbi:hypothetical protein AYI68_g2256 [Smittium mucronatum]|uniref:Uncharacterized protein n=1 Tax=Smittium mucronatum TaxID=133383 RepID=A0A1R0H350_9FUNG|nr:hypothetical protein AYI68_g2256 [Smittium mucronatum]